MSTVLRIRKLDVDADGSIHVEFYAANSTHAATQDTYILINEIADFGVELQQFPQKASHEVIFESGFPDLRASCYIRLRAFVFDRTGHTALEIAMQNHAAMPWKSEVYFCVQMEAASFNRLGQLLCDWCKTHSDEFFFDARED